MPNYYDADPAAIHKELAGRPTRVSLQHAHTHPPAFDNQGAVVPRGVRTKIPLRINGRRETSL